MKAIRVAVFTHDRPGRKPMITAYTYWYNPSWEGCCLHEVTAENGTQAKRMAIADHKARCLTHLRGRAR